MFAFASHEEIGRFGSRILAAELKPDVLIAVDVNHDYEAAPIGKDEKYVFARGVCCVVSPFRNAGERSTV